MRTAVLATPCHSGRVTAQYALSLVNSVQALAGEGIAAQVSIRAGNSVIGFARNEIVAQFLASTADDLVMIDDDMGWAAEDMVRLLSHDVPLVAAAGRVKRDDPLYCVTPLKNGRCEARGQLLEVSGVGTAFMRIRRDCAERMIAAFSETHYTARGVEPDIAPKLFNLFSAGIVDGEALSEDYAFCHRWRAIGGQVLVDPFIHLDHVGSKAYGGRLLDIMQEQP